MLPGQHRQKSFLNPISMEKSWAWCCMCLSSQQQRNA
jgi:hypothetical protein